jgi:hypothetical protein
VKQAWGQKIAIPECTLEVALDVIFVLMATLFVAGLAAGVFFLVTVRVAG